MSRTYKDKPERVKTVRHPDKIPSYYLRDEHHCGKSSSVWLINSMVTRDECDIDQVTPPTGRRRDHCSRYLSYSMYYSHPIPGAANQEYHRRHRTAEKSFLVAATKDAREGFDNPGNDEDVFLYPAKHGPYGGGYWH